MANSVWFTVTIAQGQTTSAETDLGAEYEGLMVGIPEMTGVSAAVQVAGSAGGVYFLLDKADSSGPLALPRGRATHVTCARGTRYIKLVSSATEAADRTCYVKGLRFVP